MHRLLCRLYFHQWGGWVNQYRIGSAAPLRMERTCACCGAREWRKW